MPFLLFFHLAAAGAATTVGGVIATDTVWGVSGSPYIVGSSITVRGTDGADGVTTLSIEPGVVVTFNPSTELAVGGSSGDPGALMAQGTAADPIQFTSAQSTPAPGNWKGLRFYNTARDGQCLLSHCEVAYAGAGNIGAVYVNQSQPEIRDTRVHHSSSYGINAQYADITAIGNEIDNNATHGCYISNGAPDISGTDFHDNGQYDLYYANPTGGQVTGNTLRNGIRFTSGTLTSFSGNTVVYNNSRPVQLVAKIVGEFFSANTLSNITAGSYMDVYAGRVGRDATWPALLPIRVRGNILVQGTHGEDGVTTLVIGAGATLKFAPNTQLAVGAASGVPGALIAQGTQADPVTFTSMQATPAPGDWKGLRFENTAHDTTCRLENCEVAYAGAGNTGAIYAYQSQPEIHNTRVHHSSSYGIYAQAADITATGNEIDNNATHGCYITQSAPDITDTDFHDNGQYDLYYVAPTGGQVTGNTLRNGIRHIDGTLTSFSGNTVVYNNSRPVQLVAKIVGEFFNANTLSNITAGSYMDVYAGRVGRDTTWPGVLPIRVRGNILVQGTHGEDGVTTLVIGAGATLKFAPNTQLAVGAASGVPGALMAQGTQADPVTFTSMQATPAAGDWKGLRFENTAHDSTCRLENCEVAYAGAGNMGAVYVYQSQPEIRNTRVHHSSSYGIYAQAADITATGNEIDNNATHGCYINQGAPDISGTDFHDNGQYDLYFANPTGGQVTGNTLRNGIRHIDGSLSSFSGNTVVYNNSRPVQLVAKIVGEFFSANTLSNITAGSYMDVYAGRVGRDATWPALLPIRVRGNILVQGTHGEDGVTTLVIGAGATLKFAPNTQLAVGAASGVPGALTAQGTEADPVTLTSMQATPAAGDWKGLRFENTAHDSTCRLENCVLEYAGAGNQGNLYCYNSSPTLRHCRFRHGAHAGLYLQGAGCNNATIRFNDFTGNKYGVYLTGSAQPVIRDNNFINNTSHGLYNAATVLVTAEYNWWADPAGPAGGDAVYGNVDYDPWHPSIVTGLPEAAITAAPVSVIRGNAATLSWTATNADTVTIDNGIGSVGPQGDMSVTPTATTTYTLTATGLLGSATDQATIVVHQPPTANISADPPAIWQIPSTLSWTTTNATTVAIDNGVGTVAADGSRSVTPAATTLYTITATGPGGTATDSVTVTVSPPPTAAISVAPPEIISGETTTLSWRSTLADTVTIDNGVGPVAAGGSRPVSPPETTTYTLTATGPGGTRTASVTVTVHQPPTAILSADPPTIWGNPTTLTWQTAHADTITLSPGPGTVPANGSTLVSPTDTTTYTLTATGPGGSATTGAAVVKVPPPPDLEYGLNDDEQQGGAGLIQGMIRLLNGNAIEYRPDLRLPSPHRLGLAFDATYNSHSQVQGALGHGWTHTYDTRLDPAVDIDGTQLLKITDPTGRNRYFIETGAGRFKGAFNERSRVRSEAAGYVWERTDGVTCGFTGNGKLAWIEDETENLLVLSYNAAGALESVSDTAAGRELTFHYDPNGRLTSVAGPVTAAVPTGVWSTYGHDAHGNLTTVGYADGSGVAYQYEDAADVHRLTEKRNAAGHRLATWAYDAGGRVIQSADPHGGGVAIEYVDDLNVRVTDAYGTPRTYQLQTVAGRKRLSRLQGKAAPPYADDRVVRWEFDHRMNLTETAMDNGAVHQYLDFDPNGNPREIRLAAGTAGERVLHLSYHPLTGDEMRRSEASVLGTGDKVTLRDYDTDGNDVPNEAPGPLVHRLIERGYTFDETAGIVPYEYITAFGYNARGQLTHINGPLAGGADTTAFAYDAGTGNLLSITRPLAGATVFSDHDAAGNPGRLTDANNRSTRLTRDGRGRITRIDNEADGSVATTVFNPAGLPATVTDADGVTRTFQYDPVHGHLLRITDTDGNYIAHTYDEQGNLTETGNWTAADEGPYYRERYSYLSPDIPGLPFLAIRGGMPATEYYYDTGGRVSHVIDARYHRIDYGYDLFDRVTTVTRPGNNVTTFGHDAHGNLVSVTDPETHETVYTYDDMGRLVSTTSPDTGTATFAYDAAGNRTRKTDATLVTVNYAYDAEHRLTAVTFPDAAQNIAFTYDAGPNGKGRRTGMTDPTGVTRFLYDSRGRLTEKSNTVNGIDYTLSRQYSPGGRVTGMTYPSGRQLDYTRNTRGQITQVTTTHAAVTTPLVSNMAYLPFGAPRLWDSGAGGQVNNAADTCGCLTTANPGTDREKTYTFDGNRNLEFVTAANTPWHNREYTYDELNRLTEISSPFGDLGFTYDAVGNILSRYVRYTDTGGTGIFESKPYGYVPGTHLLLGFTGTTFSYDDAGNTLTKGDYRFYYNQSGRLKKVEINGTVWGDYQYNGLGQRITKGATVFHYDFDGNIIAEGNTAGAFTNDYLYQGMNRLAMAPADTSDIYYYLNDQLGTPLLMTDDTGRVVWEARYDPFGAATVNPLSSIINNFRFQGQYFDQETGLHYNYHRYYDPSIGRYLTPDPIGLAGGINLYTYVQNNPVNFYDPDGLFPLALGGPLAASSGLGVGAADYSDSQGNQALADALWATSFWNPEVQLDALLWLADFISDDSSSYSTDSGGACPNGDDDDDNRPEKTQWGWQGSKSWRNAANQVNKGGTIKDIGGRVPTQKEAINLIRSRNGSITRIEGPHNAPNPHNFKHINYTTSNGVRGTIRIQ